MYLSPTTDWAERAFSEFCDGAVSLEYNVSGFWLTTLTGLRLTGAWASCTDSVCVCASAGAATQRMEMAREILRTLAFRRYGFCKDVDMVCGLVGIKPKINFGDAGDDLVTVCQHSDKFMTCDA